MKQVKVILEFDDEVLGEKWMNDDNLKTLLYTMNATGEHLLKVIGFEDVETDKGGQAENIVRRGEQKSEPVQNDGQ